MAEEKDQSQKTEEPTTKRISDAREKGDVANSKEVANLFMIGAGTLVFALWLPQVTDDFRVLLSSYFINAHQIRIEGPVLPLLTAQTLRTVGWLLFLPLLAFVFAALASSLVQNGLLFSFEKLKPELSKLSLLKGVKRLFSLQTVAEFIKGLLKITIVAAIALALAWPLSKKLPVVPLTSLEASLSFLHSSLVKILIGVVAAIALMAIADFIYQRFEHLKKLRMTKEEVKDEMKQTEGDPHVKARLRQIRNERSRQRMMAAVPSADVVVTNPTHFAVALSYDREGMTAPRLVAKGVDAVAHRIRDTAEEHEVPVVENPPLARALYAGVDIDQEIKPEHYQVVAEIIAYVYRLKNGGSIHGGGTPVGRA